MKIVLGFLFNQLIFWRLLQVKLQHFNSVGWVTEQKGGFSNCESFSF